MLPGPAGGPSPFETPISAPLGVSPLRRPLAPARKGSVQTHTQTQQSRVWARRRSTRSPCALPVGLQNGAAAMGNRTELPRTSDRAPCALTAPRPV